MTTVVCLVRKDGRIELTYADKAARLLARYAPQHPLQVSTESWTSSSGRLAAWRARGMVCADEHTTGGIEFADPSGCLWVSGYVGQDGDRPLAPPASSRQIQGLCGQVSDIGGVCSVFWLSSRLDSLVAMTNITRLEPVYWAENDDYIVVGTRALLVHLLALDGVSGPVYDPAALPAFLAGGFFADESVPFAGVRLLPPNAALLVEDGRARLLELSDALHHAGQREFTSHALDELADIFMGSFTSLRQRVGPVSVALTGGKDSRLIAAALKSAKMPFQTYIVDFGAANAADVCASVEVARRLGVKHEVRHRGPAQEPVSSTLQVDPLRIARDTLYVTDGMLSAYEIVPRRVRYAPHINLSGNGGELLRGGYAKSPRAWAREEVRAHLRKTFGCFGEYVSGGLAGAYDHFLDSWVDRQPQYLEGASLLDRFYLFYRCGRWSAAARAGYSPFQNLYQPLFDARLIGRVQALRIEPRLDDRLSFELLQRLAPELLDLPFANKHWLFASAAQQQADRARFPAFYRRSDGMGAAGLNLDWRTRFATQLRQELRHQIFEGPGAEALFEVLDRDRLLTLFESPKLAESRNKIFLFAVYTLSVLLSNDWLEAPREGRVVTIDATAP